MDRPHHYNSQQGNGYRLNNNPPPDSGHNPQNLAGPFDGSSRSSNANHPGHMHQPQDVALPGHMSGRWEFLSMTDIPPAPMGIIRPITLPSAESMFRASTELTTSKALRRDRGVPHFTHMQSWDPTLSQGSGGSHSGSQAVPAPGPSQHRVIAVGTGQTTSPRSGASGAMQNPSVDWPEAPSSHRGSSK